MSLSNILNLIVYSSPLFNSHWAFWITSETNPRSGRVIHATGDLLNGFKFEIKRNYKLDDESRAYQIVPLGEISGNVPEPEIPSEIGTEETVIEISPRDRLERLMKEVPVPGPSLRGSHGDGRRGVKIEVKDCQYWVHEVVTRLVNDGLLGHEALDTVDHAPKH
ncbi:MAG: hypothetical protein M1820_004787 [Bogoriella megaspora]|nr:MAG: hypothetical protein M1820_004787 [Bogoriella megaspora]